MASVSYKRREFLYNKPEGRKEITVLEKLKGFDASRAFDTDEVIALYAFGNTMKAAYQEFSMEAPSWFDDSMKTISREIKLRNAANLERMLREATSRMESLKSRDERKADLEAEINRLREKMAAA